MNSELKCLLIIFLVCLNIFTSCNRNPFPKTKLTIFGKIALKESLQPILPGIPGERAFWNINSKRFIFAPAFQFKEIPGVKNYRYTAISDADSQAHIFEAEKPWLPLTSIWKNLPNGNIELKVEALDPKTKKPIETVGSRKFLKSPSFNGIKNRPAFALKESGYRSLRDLLHQPKIQYWLENGKPDPEYPLWVHPTKIMGAVAVGMIHYAKYFPEADDVDQALKMAKIAADFLLSMVEPEGRPLEYWPPTYWDGVPRGEHPIFHGEIMTNYPAEGAMMFLDMYDFTIEQKYFDEAVRIADTYMKSLGEDGTWSQILNKNTGEPASQNRLIPTVVIKLFDRLQKQYHLDEYQDSRERAFQWCLENPVQTFNWQAQFEDTRPKPPYKNLSRSEVTDCAVLLFEASKSKPEYMEMAKELLRFAEDQFVVWDENDPVTRYEWFRKDSKWNGTTLETGCDWFLPCVLEQYKFYTPISRSSEVMILAYLKAYEITGEAIYHAKAVALANAIPNAQAFHGGGEIPTHMRKTLPELNWINCGVYTAITLIEYAEILEKEIDY